MIPGIYKITMAEYLELPAFNSSLATLILSESPRHAWTNSWLNPNRERETSKIADIGTVAHTALLEGNFFFVTVIDREDYVGKKGGVPIGWTNDAIREARDAAYAAGKTPILKDNMPAIEAMVKVAEEYIGKSDISGVFKFGEPEATIIWQDGPTLCKARPDWLSDTTVLHYKTTTGSVNPRVFSRLAENMGYDVALMFYLRGAAAVDQREGRSHYILAQEQNAPYACKLFDLSQPMADIAARKVDRALNAWASCVASGRWPAYDGSVHSIEITPWAIAAEEQTAFTEKELEGGIPL